MPNDPNQLPTPAHRDGPGGDDDPKTVGYSIHAPDCGDAAAAHPETDEASSSRTGDPGGAGGPARSED